MFLMTIRCPVCDGPLEVKAEGAECEVGHAFTHLELDAEMLGSIRKTLWLAVRTLDDEMSRLKWLRQSGTAVEVRGRTVESTAEAADVLRTFAKRWDGVAGPDTSS